MIIILAIALAMVMERHERRTLQYLIWIEILVVMLWLNSHV